jgi:hypothetical protein
MKNMIVIFIFAAVTLSFTDTIWNEGFEHGGAWPTGWTYSSRWYITGPGHNSTYAARGQVTPPGSEWCRSPSINWSNYSNRTLHFYYKFYQNNPSSTFNITIGGNLWMIEEPAIGSFHYYEISIPNGLPNSSIQWTLVTALCDSDPWSFDLIDDSAWLDSVWVTGTIVGIDEEEGGQIAKDQISELENYPNPFTSATTIKFVLPYAGHVCLTVYDAVGQHVATLVDNELQPGEHRVVFNTKNVLSGVYYYSLRAGEFTRTKRCVLLK